MNFHPIENSKDTSDIVVPKLIQLFNPKSVIDFGCNIGAWLKSFEENGVKDVLGIDGDNMIESFLIDKSKFITHDLTTPLESYEKFDLAICIEVAEHIEEKYADTLIDTLTKCSDTIFFSAATKGQGGYNHVNEQPNEYWAQKFIDKGYEWRRLSMYVQESLPHDYYRTNGFIFKKKYD